MSEEFDIEERPMRQATNGYVITAWVLALIALTLQCFHIVTGANIWIAIVGLIYGGVGLTKLEEEHGKKCVAMVSLILNFFVLLPFLFL